MNEPLYRHFLSVRSLLEVSHEVDRAKNGDIRRPEKPAFIVSFFGIISYSSMLR
jgi:hypothetical protein